MTFYMMLDEAYDFAQTLDPFAAIWFFLMFLCAWNTWKDCLS